MRTRQRGFSMLETALVVLLVGSAMAVAFLVVRMREPARQVQAQDRALQWADEALLAYAARNARLPCAVSTPTSAMDDCVGPGQKGWLPVRDLEAVHPGGAAPTSPLRYMVYRGGTDSDLATAANLFNPHKWDDEEHDFTAVNGLDLCAALENAMAAGVRGDRARTKAIDGSLVNVAYGLSAAGPTPGEGGERHDGDNALSGAVMEAPSRGVDARYDDRVRVRDFEALARSLGCNGAPADKRVALAAVDLLALAVDISDEVDDQHAGNIEDTDLAVAMAAVSEVFATINVALSAANISNSVSTLATASGQLAGAIASCVVLVGCAFIPIYTAAVTAAGVAIGLSTAATVVAATALGLTTAALAKTIIARDLAHTPIPRGPTDISDLIEQTCMTAEGGWRTHTVDSDGKKIPLDPPQWQDGLKQEVAEVRNEIEETKTEIAEAYKTLKAIREYKVPLGGLLIDYDYNKPTQGEKESDEDYQKRYDKWKEEQPAIIQEWETRLTKKLAAIEKAEQARVEYNLADQAAKDASAQLDRMNTAIASLQEDVLECNASPPGTPDGRLRCDNARNSLAGLLDCDSEYTSTIKKDGYLVRQCLAAVKKASTDANKARQAAYNKFWSLQYSAAGLPDPPLINYIFNPGCGFWFALCNMLIIPMQDFDDDDRETYAATYYKWMELQNLLGLKEKELADKIQAYDKAQAQCDALRAMNTGTGNGATMPPVWSGAAAILEAADCRGATGPVQPLTCEAKP